jgi:hypothetical protein
MLISLSTMEFRSMISGNGVPAASDCDERVLEGADNAQGSRQGGEDSQPLRLIQNLIDKLEVVNKQLSFPLRARPVPWPEETNVSETEQT